MMNDLRYFFPLVFLKHTVSLFIMCWETFCSLILIFGFVYECNFVLVLLPSHFWQTFWFLFRFKFRVCVSVYLSVWVNQKMVLCSQFSISIFTWVLGIELRTFCGKWALSHFDIWKLARNCFPTVLLDIAVERNMEFLNQCPKMERIITFSRYFNHIYNLRN